MLKQASETLEHLNRDQFDFLMQHAPSVLEAREMAGAVEDVDYLRSAGRPVTASLLRRAARAYSYGTRHVAEQSRMLGEAQYYGDTPHYLEPPQ